MQKTIVLRFRDLVADTVAEHRTCLEQFNHVWWGWWRKPTEPQRLKELGEFGSRVHEGPQRIGLFDKSRQAFFLAEVDKCIFSEEGQFLASPEPAQTPEYYRNAKLPAWFRLQTIATLKEAAFVELFDTVPLGDETLYPVLGDLDHAASVRSHAALPTRLRGDTILHLTDVHFGVDFGFPPASRPGQQPLLDLILQDVETIGDCQIGLVVVSGDLTSRGDASHLFNNALPFLETLADRLHLERNHIVVVPGNHDISLKEFALTYDHERAFNTFLQTFYGAPTQQHRLMTFQTPGGRSIELLTMSSVKLRDKETSNYGWVDWQSCEMLLKGAGAPEAATLRIAVLHHHLMSALRDERLPDTQYPAGSVSVTLNAGVVIEGLQRHGFGLVLHGHQHTPGIYRVARGRLDRGSLSLQHLDEPLYALAGGSAGARADRIDGDVRDNAYALLRISAGAVSAQVRAYNPSGAVRDLFDATLRL